MVETAEELDDENNPIHDTIATLPTYFLNKRPLVLLDNIHELFDLREDYYLCTLAHWEKCDKGLY